MNVTLNTDKHGMCFIGSFAFNFDNPGPIEVDVQTLSVSEVKQFMYNHKRGVLFVDNVDELLEAARNLSSAPSTSITNEIQQRTQPRDIIEQDTAALRKLLREKVEDIKDTVAVMSPSNMRKLIDLEKHTKNRKSLVKYLEDLYNLHVGSVLKNMEDVKEDEVVSAEVDSGLSGDWRKNISEILETDLEKITFTKE